MIGQELRKTLYVPWALAETSARRQSTSQRTEPRQSFAINNIRNFYSVPHSSAANRKSTRVELPFCGWARLIGKQCAYCIKPYLGFLEPVRLHLFRFCRLAAKLTAKKAFKSYQLLILYYLCTSRVYINSVRAHYIWVSPINSFTILCCNNLENLDPEDGFIKLNR